jgi:hypothetical protein
VGRPGAGKAEIVGHDAEGHGVGLRRQRVDGESQGREQQGGSEELDWLIEHSEKGCVPNDEAESADDGPVLANKNSDERKQHDGQTLTCGKPDVQWNVRPVSRNPGNNQMQIPATR